MLSLIGIKSRRKAKKTDRASRPRTSVRLRRRRQFLIAIGSVGLAIGLAAGIVWVRSAGYIEAAAAQLQSWGESTLRTAGLSVREVYVVGRERADRSEILRTLKVQRGDLIFGFAPDKARDRLLELGWIERAEVYRRLPDIVEVRLVEREPLALWQHKGRLALIDRDGAVIRRDGLDQFRDLPIVLGHDAHRHAAELVDMLRLKPGLFAKVDAATRIGNRRWNVTLKNGVEVNLPEKEPQASWIRLAELVAEHRLFERDIKVIDMRLPDRFVVRMTPDAAAKQRDPGKDT